MSPDILSSVVSTDDQRFCVRAASKSLGLDWLTVNAPSEQYRDQLVGKVAQKVATLLMCGNVAAPAPAFRTLRRSRHPALNGELSVKELSPTQLNTILHAAGSDLGGLKERVQSAIKASAKTIAGVVSRADAQARLDPFFSLLSTPIAQQ